MQKLIDQVLTPEFLDESGLKPGTLVNVEVREGAISIQSANPNLPEKRVSAEQSDESAAHLVEINGRLVFTGKWIGTDDDALNFVNKMREERS